MDACVRLDHGDGMDGDGTVPWAEIPRPPVDPPLSNASQDSALTSARITKIYLPLAISWIFMAVEAPVCQSLISRLPSPTVNSAAMLVVLSLSIWIESPVIDLLSTSTTLAKGKRSYETIRRFAMMLMAAVTVVHGLIAFTPLYWVFTRSLLGLPVEVAEAARHGLMIMTPWSAFIGWRRYHQGLMISRGETKMIGFGTLSRVATVSLLVLFFYLLSRFAGLALPSIAMASMALVTSVAVESTFVHFAAKPLIRAHFTRPTDHDDRHPLTLRRLAKFHFPLTATTMVMLVGGPLVSAALSRAPDSVLVMAGWQVAMTLTFLHRTVVFALPEVVITLYHDEQSKAALRQFCVTVGLVASGLMPLMALLTLDRFFFSRVVGAEAAVVGQAHMAYLAGMAMPLLGALQSLVRGLLTKHHRTSARLRAMLVGMATLCAGLYAIVTLGVSGVVSASVVLMAAVLVELGALWWSWRKVEAQVRELAATPA
ncbi:MAG: hypothetical protein KIS66_16925 [Fimbriimonadaceae bacterium]|nr:hypothetical protein [Fimbriimonadaceae bacterium]